MFRKRHPEAGARPGTLLLNPDSPPTEMQVVHFQANSLASFRCARAEEIPRPAGPGERLWLDVQGLGNGELLQALADRFRISPLAMEDLVNTPQRPKVEQFEHQQLIITHCPAESAGQVAARQLGIIVSADYVLTFHQGCGDVLAPVRHRLSNLNARLRRKGPDYLLYAVIDACVDGYYPILETLGEQIESLEHESLSRPRPELLAQIHRVKNELIQLRRSVWPAREMVHSLVATDSVFIQDETRAYFQDVLDHCNQLADVIDMYRESTSGLVNTYMSAVAHRSNEIMKVLTLLTSVFVPPTFVAGVYGMNFSGMPELNVPGAYPLALMGMAMMIAGALVYFQRRGWLISSPIDARAVQQPVVRPNAQSQPHILNDSTIVPRRAA